MDEFREDDPHKDILRAFVSEKKLDGAALTGYVRKDFGLDIVEFGNDKRLKGKAMKLRKLLLGFDIAKISGYSQNDETKEPEGNDSENEKEAVDSMPPDMKNKKRPSISEPPLPVTGIEAIDEKQALRYEDLLSKFCVEVRKMAEFCNLVHFS